ncbi:hypothetical protein A0H81_04365 [Grifola frondosa]|uniref:Uncharacterized protein n=1 Tax=Grifola frondosa TaxID=5627 RepID=A0A1C7MLI0_GRIFR|nr:hypothetical protein A0H81_04365 [Grifola frondosa]
MDVFLPYKPPRRAMEEERIEIYDEYNSQYKGEEDWDSSDDRESTEDEDEQSDNSQESGDISSDESGFEVARGHSTHVLSNASGVAANMSLHTLRTQEAIAAHEISWLTEERSALHFYAPKCLSDLPSLRSHTPRSLPARYAPGTRPSISAISTASSQFTLFRTPPAWDTLPSSPSLSSTVTLGSCLSEAADETGSHKRKRVAGGELDEDILRAEEARKSARAREGVRSLMGMVQRRTAAVEETEGTIRTQASKIGRVNPFLRGTQADPSAASSSRQTGQKSQNKVTSSRTEPSAASSLIAAPSPVRRARI